MSKSKYDRIPDIPTAEMPDLSGLNSQVENSIQQSKLEEQTNAIKQLIVALKKTEAIGSSLITMSQQATDALKDSNEDADRIVRLVEKAISDAQNCVVKVQISNNDRKFVAAHIKQLIDVETKMLAEHEKHLQNLMDENTRKIEDRMKAPDGIHLTGWIAKAAMWSFWILFGYAVISLMIFISLAASS